VKEFGGYQAMFFIVDPCRLVRQVKEFVRWLQPGLLELLHLPDEPAGVLALARAQLQNLPGRAEVLQIHPR